MTKYTIYETREYREWLEKEPLKLKRQVLSRVLKIEEEGHFGHHKYLESADIWELKFNDGRRVYYTIIPETKVILLLGGNKNGQDKDIKNAANILRKISQS
jgi:putative addiction module killer protein